MTLSPTWTLIFKTIPCIGEVIAPSTGEKGRWSESSIWKYPVGKILTSNMSPSTSTLYSVGIAVVLSESCDLGLSSSSSASPLKNLAPTSGYNAKVRTSSGFLTIPSSSPNFLYFSSSGSSKSAGLQSIGFSSPNIFL